MLQAAGGKTRLVRAAEQVGLSRGDEDSSNRGQQCQRGHDPKSAPPLGQYDPVGRQRGCHQDIEAAAHPLLSQHRRRGQAEQQQAKRGLKTADEREGLPPCPVILREPDSPAGARERRGEEKAPDDSCQARGPAAPPLTPENRVVIKRRARPPRRESLARPSSNRPTTG